MSGNTRELFKSEIKNIGGKFGKSHDLLSIAETADLFSTKYKPFKYESDRKKT